MKWEDIEKRFGDYVNSKEDTKTSIGPENLHGIKVWDEIKERIVNRRLRRTYWWAAASIIGVIILSGMIFSSKISNKNFEIARLKSELVSLRDTQGKLISQVTQLQKEKEVSDIEKPESIIVESGIKDEKIPSAAVKVNQYVEKNSIADTLVYPPVAEILNTENFIAKIEVPDLTDSLNINVLPVSDIALLNNTEFEVSRKRSVHYKIDYGDMANNDTLPRPWKLTITYQ